MRTARPRARQRDGKVEPNGAVFDQNHAVGNGHGFADVVGHQQHSEAMLAPQTFNQLLHLDAGQGIQRTQRFVQQQQTRLVNQRAGQGHTLFLPARQRCRPLVGSFGKADFFQRVRAAYLRRAAAAPQRVRLIDASRKPDEIRAEVEAIILGACFQ